MKNRNGFNSKNILLINKILRNILNSASNPPVVPYTTTISLINIQLFIAEKLLRIF